MLSAADATLTPMTAIDGFVLACLIDHATGMVLASAPGPGDIDLPAAAAGAADIANVLSMTSARIAAGETLDDVIVTYTGHLHLIRFVRRDAGQRIMLLVILDRRRANLAMARREIRDFCTGLAA